MVKSKVRKIVAREGTVTVSRTILKKSGQKQKKIQIRPFVTETAMVGIKFGATIPTMDYANAKVDVFISVPCYVEEIPDVYQQVRDMADELIEKETARLTGEEASDD